MNKFDQQSFSRQTIIRIGSLDAYATSDHIRDLFLPFGPILRVVVPLEEKSTSTTDSSTSTSNNNNNNNNQNTNTNSQKNQIDSNNQSTLLRNRGFALVEYQYPEDAEQAIKNMNDADFFGRTLTVSLAQSNVQKAASKWDIVDDNTEMKDE